MAHHIKEIVDKYIEKNRKKQKKAQKIEEILKKIVGKKSAENIQVELREKNQLALFLKSSGAAYEVKLQKGKIVEKIKEEIPGFEKVKIEIK